MGACEHARQPGTGLRVPAPAPRHLPPRTLDASMVSLVGAASPSGRPSAAPGSAFLRVSVTNLGGGAVGGRACRLRHAHNGSRPSTHTHVCVRARTPARARSPRALGVKGAGLADDVSALGLRLLCGRDVGGRDVAHVAHRPRARGHLSRRGRGRGHCGRVCMCAHSCWLRVCACHCACVCAPVRATCACFVREPLGA